MRAGEDRSGQVRRGELLVMVRVQVSDGENESK